MDVKTAIEKRRAYRVLQPGKIDDSIIEQLINAAKLAPSCFNKQPWKYLFIKSDEMLNKMKAVFAKGNEWTFDASLIVVVFGKKEDDCIIKDRIYYQFDIGLSSAFMILRATEMGLVAHPIAGYSPKKVKELTNIPADMDVITLILVGKRAEPKNQELADKLAAEEPRPKRKDNSDFVFYETYQ
jgi:nitroreductase